MNIVRITSGLAQENGYVLEKEGTVLIVDPGTDDPKFFEAVDRFGVLHAILLTHAHFDHIGESTLCAIVTTSRSMSMKRNGRG